MANIIKNYLKGVKGMEDEGKDCPQDEEKKMQKCSQERILKKIREFIRKLEKDPK